MTIKMLTANKVLNSAGNWTIETTLTTQTGEAFTASVPAGISTGRQEKETTEVDKAIYQIEREIFPKIAGKHLTQDILDRLLEEETWGSNTTLSVSAAFFKTINVARPQKPPLIMMLIFEGEKHGNPKLTIQEFMVVVNQIEEGLSFFKKVKEIIEEQGMVATVGSEGGFSPPELNDQQILEIMTNAGAKKIALDVAGNENPPTVEQMVDLVKNYPIVSVEDPFEETTQGKWYKFYEQTRAARLDVMIVGDDLTVTDEEKIKECAQNELINAVVIKPNQQGTISAAEKAVIVAKQLGLKTIASHRGEETNDDWIVDFAIKTGVDFVKFGAPSKGERISKYNRLKELLEQKDEN